MFRKDVGLFFLCKLMESNTMLPYTIFKNNFQYNYLIFNINSTLQVEIFG